MHRLCLVIVVLFGSCATAAGQEPEDVDPVESGSRALSRAATFPWYDSGTQRIVPVEVRPSGELLENRLSGWLKRPEKNTRNWNWNWGSWRSAREFFTGLGWFLLAILLAALVVLLGWALMQRDRRRVRSRAASGAGVGKEAHTTQIENLPFPLEPTELDLLSEARRHFEAGNYEQAIIYLFSYQLVQLDHRQLVRLARGKTNRQYLRELRGEPKLRKLLEQTMIRFEDAFFGGHRLTRDQFSHCWERLGEFHQFVEQPAT